MSLRLNTHDAALNLAESSGITALSGQLSACSSPAVAVQLLAPPTTPTYMIYKYMIYTCMHAPAPALPASRPQGTNQLVADWSGWTGGRQRVGIIMADFPGLELIKRIIAAN